MSNLIHALNSKKFRYGAFSTLTAIVVIAVLIVVNLIFSSLNLSYDVSKNKSYSISKYSIDIIKKVQDPINIYVLAKTGSENPDFKAIILDYTKYNRNIKVEVKDPNLYPQLVDKFKSDPSQSVSSNSVVVENEKTKKFKLIDAGQMITIGFDQQSYKEYVQSIDVEPQITNAIENVTGDKTHNIYSITGNGELSLPEKLIHAIKLANYEMKDINVLTEEVPKETNLIFATTPAKDWTPEMANKVKNYLQNGGHAVFALNFTTSGFPNLMSVLGAYGVSVDNKVIIEANTNNSLPNQPTVLLPNLEANEITKNLADKQYKVLLPVATGIKQNNIKRNSLRVNPLLTSSAKSYAKNSSAQSVEKVNGDISGPFNLAVMITDYTNTKTYFETKLVVIGTDTLISPESNSVSGGTNYNFIVNSINWTQGKESGSYIPPKAPNAATQLQLSGGQAVIITLVTVIIIPLTILVIGIVVWARRRNS
ncbi:GldG family protein [Paenibacillus radicis (ex Xue et al. 2023)]|uniref:GldG family protein n=1 Tax=Paenibacillus radicis (ex Xue et al. 2023) TaxID=2972489 RepID=A0ABT1YG11_9BACL|nr:GldG family protein [Paenibacillus radicis (ex Xue et al. 2023)]MCR8632137.1 GldG family protein [Paenibacillus radicis (ex Xue et al. 2023)]